MVGERKEHCSQSDRCCWASRDPDYQPLVLESNLAENFVLFCFWVFVVSNSRSNFWFYYSDDQSAAASNCPATCTSLVPFQAQNSRLGRKASTAGSLLKCAWAILISEALFRFPGMPSSKSCWILKQQPAGLFPCSLQVFWASCILTRASAVLTVGSNTQSHDPSQGWRSDWKTFFDSGWLGGPSTVWRSSTFSFLPCVP